VPSTRARIFSKSRLAGGGDVIGEGRETTVVRGAQPFRRNKGGCLDHGGTNLTGRLDSRSDGIHHPDEDYLIG